MTITNVTVETSTEYGEYPSRTTKSKLTLKINIPGGQAIYSLDVTDDFKTSIEYASGLIGK